MALLVSSIILYLNWIDFIYDMSNKIENIFNLIAIYFNEKFYAFFFAFNAIKLLRAYHVNI